MDRKLAYKLIFKNFEQLQLDELKNKAPAFLSSSCSSTRNSPISEVTITQISVKSSQWQ